MLKVIRRNTEDERESEFDFDWNHADVNLPKRAGLRDLTPGRPAARIIDNLKDQLEFRRIKHKH